MNAKMTPEPANGRRVMKSAVPRWLSAVQLVWYGMVTGMVWYELVQLTREFAKKKAKKKTNLTTHLLLSLPSLL